MRVIPLPLYILAGGRSSRFGSDKARAVIQGQPLIRRVAGTLVPFATRITVVADVPGKYADLGLATIADATPHQGPMGGLATALADCEVASGSSWLLLVACDLVDIRSVWVDRLLAHTRGGAAGRNAVVFMGQRWEPLLALYHTSILPEVTQRMTQGDRAMQRLLETLATVAVPLPADWPTIAQINTHEDWLACRRASSSRA